MKVSRSERHSVALAVRLAGAGRRMSSSELAAAEGLPEPTVAKVLGELRRAGVVVSSRGRNGGYELATRPGATDLRTVLGAVGTPLFDGSLCRGDDNGGCACIRNDDCGIRPVWRHLERVIDASLRTITLADMVERTHRRQAGDDGSDG